MDILSTYYNSEYGLKSGNKYATPHVAGSSCVIQLHHPIGTPTEVKSALLRATFLPTTLCDGKSHGYFSGDADYFKEPLLYINNQEVREKK